MCGSAALQVLICMLPRVDRLYQKIENDIDAENREEMTRTKIDKTETNTTVLPGQEIDAEN